jgi:hypothetical protein
MVEKTIWMLWLQGVENAPDLVKACKASWTRHNANWTIHFLRAETLGEHISASAEFDTLRERAPVILSDIIRNELLADMAASGLMPPLFACVRSMNGSNWRLHPDFLRSTGRSLEYRPTHAVELVSCRRQGELYPKDMAQADLRLLEASIRARSILLASPIIRRCIWTGYRVQTDMGRNTETVGRRASLFRSVTRDTL